MITLRTLVTAVGYERRSPGACVLIDQFLEENDLEVEPHYLEVWPDVEVELRPKPKAKKRRREDPIKRIGLLKAANTMPTTVDNSDPLEKAITLIRQLGIRTCLEQFQLPFLFNVYGQCLGLILEEAICGQCSAEVHEEVVYGAMT